MDSALIKVHWISPYFRLELWYSSVMQGWRQTHHSHKPGATEKKPSLVGHQVPDSSIFMYQTGLSRQVLACAHLCNTSNLQLWDLVLWAWHLPSYLYSFQLQCARSYISTVLRNKKHFTPVVTKLRLVLLEKWLGICQETPLSSVKKELSEQKSDCQREQTILNRIPT